MSRIGKKPIIIPDGVQIQIEGQKLIVKGPKGELVKEFPSEIEILQKENKIFVSPRIQAKLSSRQNKKIKAFWGLVRTLIFNMIEGVTKGFEKKLEIQGVGYRAALEGENLVLEVGYSHPLKVKCPEGIKFLVQQNIITVSGIDKELVGNVAAEIRKLRKPEPYKGKGIRYFGEKIKIKPGKKVVTAQ